MSNKLKRIIAWTLAVCFLVCALVAFLMVRGCGISPSITRLDNRGVAFFRGDTLEVPSISNYMSPTGTRYGDSIALRFDLPEFTGPTMTLRFRSVHVAFDVFQGGERIYTYGHDRASRGKFIGSGFHYVPLFHSASGKPIELRAFYAIDDNRKAFYDFDLLPSEYANSDYYARHVFALVVGAFLTLFGILALLVGVATAFYGISASRPMMIGLLSTSLGLWTLCYMKLFQIISFNLTLNSAIEYMSLYFAPLPFCLLLMNMRKGKITAWRWWGILVVVIIGAILLIVNSILHFTGVAPFPKTLPLFHFYVGVGMVYLVASGALYSSKMELSGKVLTLGVVFFAVVTAFDLVRYNLCLRYSVGHSLLEMTWLPFAALVFVMMLMASYLIYLFHILEDKAEKDVLSTMAYVDSLTGLFNRAKCQQIFGFLDKSTADFAIVSIDLNGLKMVNDHYGHAVGDNLIKAFASVLKQAFAGLGTAIRMGGDEFLAIVRNEHVADLPAAIDKMLDLQKNCRQELPIPLEAAYGIAYRSESGGNADTVYRAADKRMYDMKSTMKSKLVRK
ncbi:GGDEF domain-containing protein [Fibrobacter sp. UWR2]|uniref:GGDEF domain-containing protein n=1 Tax=Fibrobacter sp. UWR2 TaxID=1964352 RepID=UPI000B524969|nr:GGDEF domain-containing protein [Fibrobacter sp. UWR2]OWU99912.1 hypothetical protein B7994_09570 [Fibrobacter sp. UWR2]